MYLRIAEGLLLLTSALCNVAKGCQRNYSQRCYSCAVSYSCSDTITEEQHSTDTDCWESCDLNPLCLLAEYSPDNRTCTMYNCSEVGLPAKNGSVVLRKSCSSDCNTFQLTRDVHRSNLLSSCEIQVVSGTPPSCLAKCMDTYDCQAVLLPTAKNDCRLCSSAEVLEIHRLLLSSDGTPMPMTFPIQMIEKICLTDDDDITAKSSEPSISTETCSAVYSYISLSRLSSSVAEPVTDISPPSSSAPVSSNAFTSHLKVSCSSGFFDEVRNIAIVSSICGISVVTVTCVVCYCLVISKCKKRRRS